MKVFALEADAWYEAEQNGLTPAACLETVEAAAAEAARLLPTLSQHLNIAVRPYFQSIIPEYGTGARTWDSEFIELWFDKNVPSGPAKTLQSLGASVYHESDHAARWNTLEYDDRLLESAVFEGLATVFERKHAGYRPLYGEYGTDEEMRQWLDEVIAAGSDWSQRDALMFMTKDGRRWVGYKAGTWLIDRAITASGKSVIELTTEPADHILELAGIDPIGTHSR